MPRTVDEGFEDFLKKLKSTAAESDAAKRHRASIKACIERGFGLDGFFRAGSFGNGTNVSGYSDVDYIARIPTKSLKGDSGTTLTQVRDALVATFPNTGVRVNCPAVHVPFGKYQSEKTEVVPADFVKSVNGHNVYEIADGSGGWMVTSPAAHKAYVQGVHARLGEKVKPLVRFVKAWKFYNDVPISSFYLEMRVAEYAKNQASIVYWIDLADVLEHLQKIGLARMQDPLGIGGYISPCSTQARLADATSKLATAASRARKAYNAHLVGNTKEAFEWWDRLFNDKFPSYYK